MRHQPAHAQQQRWCWSKFAQLSLTFLGDLTSVRGYLAAYQQNLQALISSINMATFPLKWPDCCYWCVVILMNSCLNLVIISCVLIIVRNCQSAMDASKGKMKCICRKDQTIYLSSLRGSRKMTTWLSWQLKGNKGCKILVGKQTFLSDIPFWIGEHKLFQYPICVIRNTPCRFTSK